MGRCDCAKGRCQCGLVAGDGIEITGTGETSSPYTITALAQPLTGQVAVADTATLNLTLTGQGTVAEPYTFSGEVLGAPPSDTAVAGLVTDPGSDTHDAVQGVADGSVAAILGQENVWSAAQVFDPAEAFRIGTKLSVRLTDGFSGQRLHLTGVPGNVPAVMPYLEVAPATDTGVGTDPGGAIAGFQVYRTPGGGGVPDREFLAIEASGDNGTTPGFKISPWASGTGVLRPIVFWDGTHEVFRIVNDGGTGGLQIGTSSRITYEDTSATARVVSIFQKQGSLSEQRRVNSSTAGTRAYIFFSKNRGTTAAPTVPVSGDLLGDVGFGSIDSGTERFGATIRATATDTAWTHGSAHGTKVSIRTAATGSSTLNEQAEFSEPATDTHTGLLVRVNKAGVKSLVRVQIGAPDSGGTGMRALVIPN